MACSKQKGDSAVEEAFNFLQKTQVFVEHERTDLNVNAHLVREENELREKMKKCVYLQNIKNMNVRA